MALKEIVTISGVSADQLYGRSMSLQAFIPAIELPTYCPMYDVSESLKGAFEEVSNKTNQKKIALLVNEVSDGLLNTKVTPPLSLTIAVRGKVDFSFKKSSENSTVTFPFKNAFIVDNPLLLSAIYQILGIKNPYVESSKIMQGENNQSTLRQKLSTTCISLTFLFDPDSGFSDSDIRDIFNTFSQRDTNFHSVSLSVSSEMPDLTRFVRDLAQSLSLDRLGGMSTSRNRITKSDGYITTEATLISLVLASLGGSKLRISRQVPKTLPDNTEISLALLEQKRPAIENFLKGWLKSTERQFLNNKDGFHYSTQLWQALGLVIYHIDQSHESDDQIFFQSGFKIGEIDYARNAEHWANCSAMQLDASGRFYKNATNGGRTFREGIAKYLFSFLKV